MITKSEARSLIRKAVKRVPIGEEIRHLNIMPMMDIMTILLVAFLMAAAQADAFSISDVTLPDSKTHQPMPDKAVTLTIGKTLVLIEGRDYGITVKNGSIDPSLKKDGASGLVVPKIAELLGTIRRSNEEEAVRTGKKRPDPELMIVADKATPYKLFFEILLSSRDEYKRFRLIVMQDATVPVK